MTAPAPRFPALRDLAVLWTQLRPWQPQALWLGALMLHRAEALVGVIERTPTDWLLRAVLERAAQHGVADAHDLQQALGLPLGMGQVVLENLKREGWIAREGAPWRLTATGQVVHQRGLFEQRRHERRVFYFTDPAETTAACYWPLAPGLAAPSAPAGAEWRFDPAWLEACITADDAWKATHRFPLEVEHLCRIGGAGLDCADVPTWQRIILDQAERLTLAIVGGDRCLGFALNPGTWRLLHNEPVFRVGPDQAANLLGSLLVVPDEAAWRTAWETHRRPLGLPPGEVGGFRTTSLGPRVSIKLPRTAAERARSVSPDQWLLAGAGPFRCAALPELEMAR